MSQSLRIAFMHIDRDTASFDLQRIANVFLNLKFEIYQFEIKEEMVSWNDFAKNPAEITRVAHDAHGFSFRCYHDARRLEIYQQVAWEVGENDQQAHIWMSSTTDNTPYFWRVEYDPPAYSRFLLDVGKHLYAVGHPRFGWIDFDFGLFTSYEDIELLELPILYWANFFSPIYVSKIGRSKILTAPAHNVEELPDGGFLYVLSSCPGHCIDHVPIEDVKRHFGVSRVR